MNETSFVHSITKRRLHMKAQAQAADFYTPNQFSNTIVLKTGCPWMRDWPDHDLVNNKQGTFGRHQQKFDIGQSLRLCWTCISDPSDYGWH